MNQRLERDVLFHLHEAWVKINYQLFDDVLLQPTIKLSDRASILGEWDGQKRVISLSRSLVMGSQWLEVIEVLKHEMAHQYVQEQTKATHESPHGPTFQRVCRERGINLATRGELTLDPEVEKLLSRINKLLALAQSDNLHEAELAAKRAQTLLTQHHIKLETQEYSNHDNPSSRLDQMSFCQIGNPKSRYYQYEYVLVNLLSDHFFVSCIWVSAIWIDSTKGEVVKKGRVVEACGRKEDLEIASYVYDFVLNHLKIAWDHYQKEHKVKGLQSRLSFSLGLVSGFAYKLEESTPHSSEEKALILRSQSRACEFLERRYPKIRNYSVNEWSPNSDYHSGFEEGKALRLRRGVESNSATTTQHLLEY